MASAPVSIGDGDRTATLPRAVGWQRLVARLFSPLWIPLVVLTLWLVLGYRIEGVGATRRAYRRITRERGRPLVVCANHLTMIDSALVAWALGSVSWYLRKFWTVPWNMPERNNFASSVVSRALAYVMKCVPITRGGAREEVNRSLERFRALLAAGDVGLLFPEGGRSRTGRVDVDAAAYGVGRLVRELPGCAVLCVYLRGMRQQGFSDLPARGDRFVVSLALITPVSADTGLRADRDIARQIVGQLAEMERQYFDTR